jgi:predicted metalloprotease with PDZ domain
MSGLPIPQMSDAFGETFALKEVSVPSFDPGFSMEQTFKSKKIKGVVENSNSYKAGLRNEMEFVSIRNSNRFGNGWSPDKPLSITVKTEGTEKIIEYFPHGKLMMVKIYSPLN